MHTQAGFTPLLQASQDGHLDIVKVLVEHAVNSGIDLDQHTMVFPTFMQLIGPRGAVYTLF